MLAFLLLLGVQLFTSVNIYRELQRARIEIARIEQLLLEPDSEEV